MEKLTKSKKDSHYARLRRLHKSNNKITPSNRVIKLNDDSHFELQKDQITLYGLHTVTSALKNTSRKIYNIYVTPNCLEKIKKDLSSQKYELISTKQLNQILSNDAVHQGILAIASPLKSKSILGLKNKKFVVLLDQITDPHNIGAIMRSCVAMKVDALITTNRHTSKETGVLAKSASGALDIIDYIQVRNLSETIKNLQEMNFTAIGLDSNGEQNLNTLLKKQLFPKIALVLGSEGKGLREKTMQTVNLMSKLDMPGAIKSLNVSNAAAIALYLTTNHLKKITD